MNASQKNMHTVTTNYHAYWVSVLTFIYCVSSDWHAKKLIVGDARDGSSSEMVETWDAAGKKLTAFLDEKYEYLYVLVYISKFCILQVTLIASP